MSSPKRSKKMIPPPPPTIRSLLASRLKGWTPIVAFLVGLAAFVGAVVGGWNYAGGPTLVSDKTLTITVTGVKTELTDKINTTKSELTDKINTTKNEVVATSAKNTADVQTDVGAVKKTLDGIARKQDRQDVRTVESQVRLLFLQKTQVASSIAAIESQIREKPSDTFLIQRRVELTTYMQTIEQEMTAAQADLRALKNGGG